LNFQGIVIGLCSFLIIGLFHPIVIKIEYHFGKRAWPLFLVSGIAFIVISLFLEGTMGPSILSILGFSCLWSIHEIIEQEERVKRGWFPANEKKHSVSKK
jgi:hypothetical protein